MNIRGFLKLWLYVHLIFSSIASASFIHDGADSSLVVVVASLILLLPGTFIASVLVYYGSAFPNVKRDPRFYDSDTDMK